MNIEKKISNFLSEHNDGQNVKQIVKYLNSNRSDGEATVSKTIVNRTLYKSNQFKKIIDNNSTAPKWVTTNNCDNMPNDASNDTLNDLYSSFMNFGFLSIDELQKNKNLLIVGNEIDPMKVFSILSKIIKKEPKQITIIDYEIGKIIKQFITHFDVYNDDEKFNIVEYGQSHAENISIHTQLVEKCDDILICTNSITYPLFHLLTIAEIKNKSIYSCILS